MTLDVTLILFAIYFIATFAVITAMFLSLGKQGDERRNMIIEKASAGTFAVTVVYILFHVIESMVMAVTQGVSAEGMNPFITLVVISGIYLAFLLYFKRKYGD